MFGFINSFLLRLMLSNINSSQKEADSLIVTRRGTCLTSQTATAIHTGSSSRIKTPDRSHADAVVMVQVPGSVSSHICGKDREAMAEITRSTSDVGTWFTRKGLVRKMLL